jgi:hypothetical protein
MITHSLKYLEWTIMYTIVSTEVPEVSDHVYDCVHWSTWSEWSWIRLCSLEYLEWVIMNTITHSRYFSERNRIHDHSLQVLQWTQSYSWSLTPGAPVNTIYDCVHWSTWSERSCIRLCSLKYLEWVIMYTIVFTEVHGVSDHVCNCVHWSTWSEWSWIRLCSLKDLEWAIMYTTIVYMITHSSYFSEHNRIHDRSLQVLQWTQ